VNWFEQNVILTRHRWSHRELEVSERNEYGSAVAALTPANADHVVECRLGT
jgi:hypothetical protein